MKVAIIVLNWNGQEYISDCFKSLMQLRTPESSVEIIMVDNNSSDKSVEMVKKKFPKIKIIVNNSNLGYSGGNNVGIKYALDQNHDYIWIVNPDARVEKDSLTPLLNEAEKNSQVGILGSKIYFSPGFEYHRERYTKSQQGKVIWFAGGRIDWANMISHHIGINEVDIGQYNRVAKTEFVTGASMLIASRVIEKIGSFDEKYFLYYEENDLCQRAAKRGFDLLYVPDSVVWHDNAQATGAGSPLVDYYTTRNRLLFGFRYAPARTKLALVRESLKQISTGRPWQRKGALDFYLGKFGKGSYAIRHNNHA